MAPRFTAAPLTREHAVLRVGEESDLPALTDVYNHYVTTSIVTFDDVPFTVDQRREWFHHYAPSGPHRLVVADVAGTAVGYATSSPFRPKPGYRTSVETSVYIGPDAVGRGIGHRLYAALFAHLADQPVHRAYAGVALPNPASVALHERFGFSRIGTYEEVGTKFGHWVDVEWFQRAL